MAKLIVVVDGTGNEYVVRDDDDTRFEYVRDAEEKDVKAALEQFILSYKDIEDTKYYYLSD